MSEEKNVFSERELEGKKIEYYSVLLSAWISSKMEKDKTLVTLSAAAIGLLTTLLTTVGANSTCEIFLFTFSILSFLITLLSSLKIYNLNSSYIEKALSNMPLDNNTLLEKYDNISIYSFMLGILLSLTIGLVSASHRQEEKQIKININKESNMSEITLEIIGESLNGVTKLHPEAIQIKVNEIKKADLDIKSNVQNSKENEINISQSHKEK